MLPRYGTVFMTRRCAFRTVGGVPIPPGFPHKPFIYATALPPDVRRGLCSAAKLVFNSRGCAPDAGSALSPLDQQGPQAEPGA